MGVISDTQNSHLSTLSLPIYEVFQVHVRLKLYKISLCQIFQQSIFVLSREEYHYQSH